MVPRPSSTRRRGACGFTLIEILVALAIVAVALAAGMRALAQATDSATLLKQRTLALWVAQNQLALTQLAVPWPDLGTQEGVAAQAGARLAWKQTVTGTPNPWFRKVEVVVVEPAMPGYALATLVGYVGRGTQP